MEVNFLFMWPRKVWELPSRILSKYLLENLPHNLHLFQHYESLHDIYPMILHY